MFYFSYDEAQEVLKRDPTEFKKKVEESLIRHVAAVNKVHIKTRMKNP